jgi:anti-sigma factor RsiW
MTTSQDFDRLSAYLDNQLSERERAALEARLKAEPELRATLGELRLMVRALRALPPAKAPRSFTLTPAQVGASGYHGAGLGRRAPLFGALRLATALSLAAFVVVLTADLGGYGLATTRQAASDGGQAEASAAADTALEVAMAASDTPAAEAQADVFTLTGESATAEMATESARAPEATTAAEVEETPMVAAMAPEVTVTPTPRAAGQDATDTAVVKGVDGASATPTPREVAEVPPPAPTDDLFYAAGDDAADTQAPAPRGMSALRLMELALAMLTVLLGLGAWFSRRN